jgi:hypothetical protein
MELIERYKKGEAKAVYAEISDLEQNACSSERIAEIEPILIETFNRVRYNLTIIYEELKKLNYVFSDRPFHKPLPNTEKLLAQLDKAVKPYGYVPLSLKYFYKIVGGVDFAWNYEKEKLFLWDMADPIQICSLDELVSYICNKDGDWQDAMQEYMHDDEYTYLELSADNLHKDNVSGGMPYSLKITTNPSVDSEFLFERHETTFIDYLRICFEHCGFPGEPDIESYKEFVSRVKPQLLQI